MSGRPAPPPRWRDLFHGAVREALAAVNSVARIGIQDTHAWEKPLSYVVDDNQGNLGIVEFTADGVAAAMSHRTRRQPMTLEQAILAAPPNRRAALVAVSGLPLLASEGVTSIFWNEGDAIGAPEEWDNFGPEIFCRELLPDAEWLSEGATFYDLSEEVARCCVTVAASAVIGVPIAALSAEQLRLLIPDDSAHRATALDLVVSDALFELR